MYTVAEPPPEFDALSQRCKTLLEEILAKLPIQGEPFKLGASKTLFEPGEGRMSLYVLRDGNLAYNLRDRILFYYQEGDLIGVERDFDGFSSEITSDFATKLTRYSANDFFSAIAKTPAIQPLWTEYLGLHLTMLYSIVRSLLKNEEPVLPEVKSYIAGSVIVEQGSRSSEVFTMADGIASVVQDGKKIGTVHVDQIFGALAAFTGTPRRASVVAETDCLVLALPKDSFLDLISSKPNTIRKLIEDMAQTILSANILEVGDGMKL